MGKSIDKNFLNKKRARVYKSTSDPREFYEAKSAFVNPEETEYLMTRQLEESERFDNMTHH